MRPILRMGLQTGFGAPRGAETMRAIAAIGCELCRIQLHHPGTNRRLTTGEAEAVIGEVIDAGLAPYVIIREAAQIKQVPRGVKLELGNEPEDPGNGWTITRYWQEAQACIRLADGRNPLAIGVVGNLRVTPPWERPSGLTWLAQIPWAEVPGWVMCSHHWYPDDARPHDSHVRAWYGLGKRQTRDADIAMLRQIVGDRPLGLSETGWWDCPGLRGEGEVAAWYAEERAFWASQDYECAIAYQIDSAPPPDDVAAWRPEHGYGFREVESISAWKPRAAAWFASDEDAAA